MATRGMRVAIALVAWLIMSSGAGRTLIRTLKPAETHRSWP